MIQFCTWKAAGTTLAPAEGTVRAVESVRELGRAMTNFNHWIGLYSFIVPSIGPPPGYLSVNPVLYLNASGDDYCNS